jgi:hypothetical protein
MARLIYRKVHCVSSQNQSRAGVSPAVSIYPLSSGAIAARHSCQADTMVTSAARTNMRINKGATGSPSLSKTKGTRKSAGLFLEACQCAGNSRPHDRSAGRACVVSLRHPQVFSFPSVGIAGPPALGCCALCRGRTKVRPIHSVCRFPPAATAKCHGLRCRSLVGWHYRSAHWCGWRRDTGIRALSADRGCRHPPYTQRARWRPRHKPDTYRASRYGSESRAAPSGALALGGRRNGR